jgi:ubiquitin C-terminal hydrolase
MQPSTATVSTVPLPKGIYNDGNTCYLNSVIQVLRNTPFIRHLKYLPNNTVISAVVSALHGLTDDKQMVMAIRTLAAKQGHPQFAGSQQNDASELTYFLLDQLHQAYRHLPASVEIRGTPTNERDQMAVSVYSTLKHLYEKERSPIMEHCYGMHVSVLTNANNGTKSLTPEPYMIQHLPIPSAKPVLSLTDCLSLFLTPETVSIDNNQHQKQLHIWSIPPIWSVCFSRFSGSNSGIKNVRVSDKNNQLITYPDRISLAPYVVGYNPQQYRYRLYAVINHTGNTGGGHYYAFILNRNANRWFACNDQAVSPISAEQALNHQNAYCLFYERILGP